MRRFSVLAALFLAACATTPGGRDARLVAELAEDPAYGRQLLDNDPNPQVGATFLLTSPEFPEMRVNLFAYLVGIGDEEEALASIDEGLVASLKYAQTQGVYRELEDLDLAPSAVSVSIGSRQRKGLRRIHRATLENGAQTLSISYVFYRPPFAIKYRASFSALGNESYDREVDRLVRASLGKLSVRSPSLCAQAPEDHEIRIGREVLEENGELTVVRALGEMRVRRAQWGCEDLEAVLSSNEGLLESVKAELREEKAQ
ncbi:MAG: hypothetical protein H7A19_18970 [Rhodanobacteraceae bacterium]|nr:hypothetical protein [Rhodanobacteraceae bacterium]